jgi:hypothetical protein
LELKNLGELQRSRAPLGEIADFRLAGEYKTSLELLEQKERKCSRK